MQFTALHLKNLGVHRELDIEFRPGINGVVGPNGSGKSQILDGLRLAITGEVVAKGNITDNITWGESSALVVAQFRHGDAQYKIERSIGRGRTPPILHLPDGQVRGNAEVERELVRLLGTTIEALLNNVFVPQGAIDSILFSTNTERLREIQQTVGLHRCAEAEKALTIELGRYNVTVGLKEQLEMLTAQAEKAVEETQIAQNAVAVVDKQIEALWPYADLLQRWTADRLAFEQLAQATRNLAQAQEAHDRAATQVGEAQAVHDQLRQAVDALRPSADRARADLLAWQTGQRTRQLREQLVGQRQALVDSLAGRTPIASEQIEQAEHRAQQLQARLTLREGQLAGKAARPILPEEQELEQRLQAVRAELRALPTKRPVTEDEQRLQLTIQTTKETLAKFGTGSCPTCGQPVKDHDPGQMQAEISRSTALLENLRAEADTQFASKTSALRAQESELVGQLAEMAAALREVLEKELATLRPAVAPAVAEARALRQLAQTFDQQVDRLKQLDIQLEQVGADQATSLSGEQLQQEIKSFEDVSAQLSSSSTTLQLREQAYKAAQAALQQAQVDRQALKDVAQAPSDQQLEEAKTKVDELQARQADQRRASEMLVQVQVRSTQLQDTCGRLRKQLEAEARDTAWTAVCRRARDVLHVNGLPTLLMKEYAKVLNKRIAYYLNIWEAPFTLRLDDDLAFVADFVDGRSHSAARLSGGQKIVASTSFRLAMTDTFAKQVGLLVLDEPSNYLDKDNIVHLQTLLLKLKELSGHSGRQIILVTHEEQLTGFFDHSISVYH